MKKIAKLLIKIYICLLLAISICMYLESNKKHIGNDISLNSDYQIPIFALNTKDAQHNALKSTYIIKNEDIAQLTLVWEDEDHPNKIFNWPYDMLRWIIWGRIADVETIYLIYDNNKIKHIYLPYVYGGAQLFNSSQHLTNIIPVKKLDVFGGMPVLYVNTWNHMISDKSTSEDLVYIKPTISGNLSRNEVDSILAGWRSKTIILKYNESLMPKIIK